MKLLHVRWMALAALALLPPAGCNDHDDSEPATGTLEVRLKDAPGDVLELVVTIDRLSVHSDGGAAWVELPLNTSLAVGGAVVDKDVARGRLTIDLIQLATGQPLLLALGGVPAGRIEQIRLRVVEDRIQGTRTPWVLFDEPGALREFIKVPSGYHSGIKIVPRNVRIEAGALTSITLDFDAAHSVVRLGNATGGSMREFDYILKPVIFVLDSESLLRPSTTLATGLNFPTGVGGLEAVAGVVGDERVAVSNGGTTSTGTGSNATTVLTLNPAGYAIGSPLDASATDGSVVRSLLATAPLDLQTSEAVSGPGAFEVVAGGDLLHYVAGDPLLPNPVAIGGLLGAVEPINFGGTAAYFVGSGSQILFLNPAAPPALSLGITGLTKVTGITFLAGVPATGYGTLIAIDRGMNPADAADDQIIAAPLMVSGLTVTVSGPIVRRTPAALTFLNEPVAVERNAAGNVFVANRGNGFIHELTPDLAMIRALDTGLGMDSLNGMAAVSIAPFATVFGSTELLLLANTMGNDDPTADNPLDPASPGLSTIEVIVP